MIGRPSDLRSVSEWTIGKGAVAGSSGMVYGRGGLAGRDTGMAASGDEMTGACGMPIELTNEGEADTGVLGAWC